jgi:hypothetical protein
MKFAFAAALIVAMAFAADETEAVAVTVTDAEAKPQDNDGFEFFVEKDGYGVVNFPEIPGVSFGNVTKDTVMDWANAQ